MEILKGTKDYLTWLGILQKDEQNRKWFHEFWRLLVNLIFITGILYSFGVCSVTYIYLHPSDFGGALNAVVNTSAGCCVFGAYVGFVFNGEKIKLVYGELQHIVNNGEATIEFSPFVAYQNAEKQHRKLNRWISIIMIRATLWSIILPPIASSIIAMIRGNFDTSTWFFLGACEIPFDIDVSTVFGWYVRLFSYLLGCVLYNLIIPAIFPFVVGCCLYIKACSTHFQLMLDECDEIICAKSDNKDEQINKIAEKMKTAIFFT